MHHVECRSVMQFPNDPIVRRNAAIIEETERACDRMLAQRGATSLLGMIFGGKAR